MCQDPWRTALTRQRSEELNDQDFPEEDIAPPVFRPCNKAVLAWAIATIEPNRMCRTLRPEEFVLGEESVVALSSVLLELKLTQDGQ